MFASEFIKMYGRKPTYGCLFSGVGGADFGLEEAGFECVFQCEIDKQCRSVLRYLNPTIDIHDDVLTFDPSKYPKPDVLWASPPCQSFSVSGARKGLSDPRGQLSLHTARLLDEIDPECAIFENVPGWLSDADNAFGCFLGYIAGHHDSIPSPRGRDKLGKQRSWPNAGVVVGPRRKIAYRVIDSQGFVPQRRRRVLVIAVRNSSRIDPVRMLFESEDEAFRSARKGSWANIFTFRESLCRNPKSGGQTWEEASANTRESSAESCGCLAFDCKQDGKDASAELSPTLRAMPHKDSHQNAGGGMAVCFPIQEPGHGEYRKEGASGCDLAGEPMFTLQANSPHGDAVGVTYCAPEAPCLSASGAGMSRSGNERTECEMVVVETQTFVNSGQGYWREDEISGTLRNSPEKDYATVVEGVMGDVSPCLTAAADNGYDTDATGQGTPIVAIESEVFGFYPKTSANDSGVPQKELSPTLRAVEANAVAFVQNSRSEVRLEGGDGNTTGALCAESGVQQQTYVAQGLPEDPETAYALRANPSASGDKGDGGMNTTTIIDGRGVNMVVRRLTPRECERLQGWPDNWTRYGVIDKIVKKGPDKGKVVQETVEIKDGPRYKMCGNGVSAPVSHWLGYRYFREVVRKVDEIPLAA